VYVNKCSYYSTASSDKEDEMEDNLLVAKTLLKCYPHLDDLFEALTHCTEECINSGFYAIFPNEQLRLYERINAYERRKTGIYNMKYLIEESFRRGKGIALSLLKDRFLSRRDMGELIERYRVSLRTCYRYLKKGLGELAKELEDLGFDKKRILMEYGNEPLFMTMLNRVIKEDDSECEEAAKASQINSRPLPPLCSLYGNAFSLDGRVPRG